MTLDDVRQEMVKSDPRRVAVLVYEDTNTDEYVSAWDDQEVRSDNPFGLDSKLTYVGAPHPRNLFLVSRDDYETGFEVQG